MLNRKFLRYCFYSFLVFLFTQKEVKAQVTVNAALTPSQLVALLMGPGISYSNVTLTAVAGQTGSFNGTASNIGLPGGIILSTGNLNTLPIGSNTAHNAGTVLNTPGDTMLDAQAGAPTQDAAILQFDFIPESDSISFRYVFGSEEYSVAVCSGYNDAFGFFISGPGITGQQNLALIPGTTLPVSINSVNSGTPGIYASCTSCGPPLCYLGNSAYYVDNSTLGGTVQYDGFTVPLKAQAKVTPCETYHMRITIADASNGKYDSGVFIEAGSFTSPPFVNAGPDQSMCSGGTPVTIGGPPQNGVTYSWSPSMGLSNPNSSNPTVTLTDTSSTSPMVVTYIETGTYGSCTTEDTVQVTVNPGPQSTFSATSPLCTADTCNINYSGSGGGTPTYTWNFNGGNVISGSGAGPYQVNWNNPGTYNVTLTTSGSGCSSTTTVPVTVSAAPTSSFSITPVVCTGQMANIHYTGNAPLSASYTWNFNGANLIIGSGQGDYSVKWNTAGTYNVSLVVGVGSCTSGTTVLPVTVQQSPTADAGQDKALCSGDTISIGSASGSGNSYAWSPSTGLSNPAVSNPTVTMTNNSNVSQTLNYVLNVTSSSTGCSSQDTVNVTVYPQAAPAYTPPSSECLTGNIFNFTAEGTFAQNATFNWNFGPNANPATSTFQNPSAIHFSSPGEQVITFTVSQDGCNPVTYTDSVMVYPQPTVSFTGDSLSGCEPVTVNFTDSTSSAQDSCFWDFGDNTTSNQCDAQHVYTQPGNYNVSCTVTSAQGCKTVLTRNNYVSVYPLPDASFIASPNPANILEPIVSFTSNQNGGTSYYWNFGDSTFSTAQNPPPHTYDSLGTYIVTQTVVNQYGCVSMDTTDVIIQPDYEFFIPNAFSPNGDGFNDYFGGKGVEFTSYEEYIYDRWGHLIYHTNDYGKLWDGRLKDGTPAQEDVYVYIIYVTDIYKKQHRYIGHVSIVR